MDHEGFRNTIIRRMSDDDFHAVRRHLEPVSFKPRQILVARNSLVPYVYFPESGQASVLAKVGGTEAIEVATFGREGLSDLAHAQKVPLETVAHVAGDAHRVARETFLELMRRSVALSDLVARWQHALLIQTSFTALAHGSFTVAERLARYLLMTHDRVDTDDIPLVHDHFAAVLNVRRAGVTEALRALKSAGAVRTGRGTVTVANRETLIAIARGGYGPAESEYEKLFGEPISRRAALQPATV